MKDLKKHIMFLGVVSMMISTIACGVRIDEGKSQPQPTEIIKPTEGNKSGKNSTENSGSTDGKFSTDTSESDSTLTNTPTPESVLVPTLSVEEINQNRRQLYDSALKEIWTVFAKGDGNFYSVESYFDPHSFLWGIDYKNWDGDEWLAHFKYGYYDVTGDGFDELIICYSYEDQYNCWWMTVCGNAVIALATPDDLPVHLIWSTWGPSYSSFELRCRINDGSFVFWQDEIWYDDDKEWHVRISPWTVSDSGLEAYKLPRIEGVVDDINTLWTDDLTGSFTLNEDFDRETINDRPLNSDEAIDYFKTYGYSDGYSRYWSLSDDQWNDFSEYVPWE